MSTSKRGTFISFEGIDGCGKSTQVKILMDRLQEEGNECILVREPSMVKILFENLRNSYSGSKSGTSGFTLFRCPAT